MTIATMPLRGSFVADPIHSSFGFSVRYQGVSIYRGSIEQVEARFADGRLEGAGKVESISIRTPDAFRAHVLGPEFFDAEHHPEVTFASSAVDLADDGTATVAGELTIKGITHPVEARGTWVAPAPDAFGNTRAHVQLAAVVDRTAYDMHWNMQLPSGAPALASEVTLTVELSLVEQQG